MEKQIDVIDVVEKEDYVFLFSIGSNDPAYKVSPANVIVPFEEFEGNLQKIIELSKKYTKKIIFTGLLLVDEDESMPWAEGEDYWENKDLKKYNDAIEKICKDNNLDFIPLWDLIDKSDLHDGIHPNSKGHEKVFNRVSEFLNKVI